MTWGAIGGGAAAGLVGGLASSAGGNLFGSKQQQQTQPWKFMVPFLQQGTRNVRNLQSPSYYPGQLSAPMRQGLQQSLADTYGYGMPGGQGAGFVDAMGNLGRIGNSAAWEQFGSLYDMGQQGDPRFSYDQGTYNQVMGNLTPGLQGAYDAAMRDPIRQYSEQQIPGINQGAAMSGQAFGTRPQNQSAIAARGLADRGADVASGLWMNAANQANQAGYGGGIANLGAGLQNRGQMLQGYQGLAGLGLQGYQGANNAALGNYGLGMQAGQYEQSLAQQGIDREIQGWLYNQQSPWTMGPLQQMGSYQGTGFGQTTGTINQGAGNIATSLAGSYLMGGGQLPSFSGFGSGGGGGGANTFAGGWNGNSNGYW